MPDGEGSKYPGEEQSPVAGEGQKPSSVRHAWLGEKGREDTLEVADTSQVTRDGAARHVPRVRCPEQGGKIPPSGVADTPLTDDRYLTQG